MPSIVCGRCGGKTNTALCDWVDSHIKGKAARCYAKWDRKTQRWVKGCGFNDTDADKFSVDFAKNRILGSPRSRRKR